MIAIKPITVLVPSTHVFPPDIFLFFFARLYCCTILFCTSVLLLSSLSFFLSLLQASINPQVHTPIGEESPRHSTQMLISKATLTNPANPLSTKNDPATAAPIQPPTNVASLGKKATKNLKNVVQVEFSVAVTRLNSNSPQTWTA